jgi:hypothetical protein
MIEINSTDDLAGEGMEEVRVLMHEKATNIRKAVSTSSSMAGLRKRVAEFAVCGVGAASVTSIVGQATVVSEVAMLAGSLGVGVSW